MRGEAWEGGANPGAEPGGAPEWGGYWCWGCCGSRDADGGPPSIDDIDMEPPTGPVLAIELSEGSSRPGGNDDGGPTVRGGALGGGGPDP